MDYLLVLMGVIGGAMILARRPLVIRFVENLFNLVDNGAAPATAADAKSIESSEMRDEIRRLTALLETGRRDAVR